MITHHEMYEQLKKDYKEKSPLFWEGYSQYEYSDCFIAIDNGRLELYHYYSYEEGGDIYPTRFEIHDFGSFFHYAYLILKKALSENRVEILYEPSDKKCRIYCDKWSKTINFHLGELILSLDENQAKSLASIFKKAAIQLKPSLKGHNECNWMITLSPC